MAPVLPGPVGVACLVSKKFAEESPGGHHAEGFSPCILFTSQTPKMIPFSQPGAVLWALAHQQQGV